MGQSKVQRLRKGGDVNGVVRHEDARRGVGNRFSAGRAHDQVIGREVVASTPIFKSTLHSNPRLGREGAGKLLLLLLLWLVVVVVQLRRRRRRRRLHRSVLTRM